MGTAVKKTRDAIVREVETTSQARDIREAEIVVGRRSGHPPTSVRLSAPLLERLDRLAAQQGRKRGNLIQHVLWEYVRRHDADD